MKRAIPLLFLASAVFCTATPTDANISIRGKSQSIAFLHTPGPSKGAVLFLPGDGGWRGLAVTIAETVSRWGYDVYGFDTRKYLEAFTETGGSALTPDTMRQDLASVVNSIHARGVSQVTLLGWSQGAGMAVLAAQQPGAKIAGVVTLGLPESAVLGWNWKDTVATLAFREPDEPHFFVRPVLTALPAVPLWMIHGERDEYTKPHIARALYQAAPEPKRLVTVRGANHRFDMARGELYKSLQEGLAWIQNGGH